MGADAVEAEAGALDGGVVPDLGAPVGVMTRMCAASYLRRSGWALPKVLGRLSGGGGGVGAGVGFGGAASAAIGEPAGCPAAGAGHGVTSGMRRRGSRTERFKRR